MSDPFDQAIKKEIYCPWDRGRFVEVAVMEHVAVPFENLPVKTPFRRADIRFILVYEKVSGKIGRGFLYRFKEAR